MEKEKSLPPSDMAIGRRIYVVRGEQVMIDRNLSELYGVENRVLRQAVHRNEDKFPDDFLFKLTDDEFKDVITKGVSQSVIPSGYNTGGMQMFGPKTRRPRIETACRFTHVSGITLKVRAGYAGLCIFTIPIRIHDLLQR